MKRRLVPDGVLTLMSELYRLQQEAILFTKTREGRERVAAVQFFPGYATKKGSQSPSGVVALGNWNTPKEPEPDYTIDALHAYLISIDVDTDWEDELMPCEVCDRLLRTEPDSFQWKEELYRIGTEDSWGEVYCRDCVDVGDYLRSLEDTATVEERFNSRCLRRHGYSPVSLKADGFEHEHDEGDRLKKALIKGGITGFILCSPSDDLDGDVQVYLRRQRRNHAAAARILADVQKGVVT